VEVSLPASTRGYRPAEVEVTLRLTVCLGIEHPCGTCDQILFPVGMLLSEICGLLSMGRPPESQNQSQSHFVTFTPLYYSQADPTETRCLLCILVTDCFRIDKVFTIVF
jgi:hypothetical protein